MNSSLLYVLHLDSLKTAVKELQKVSGILPDTPRTFVVCEGHVMIKSFSNIAY